MGMFLAFCFLCLLFLSPILAGIFILIAGVIFLISWIASLPTLVAIPVVCGIIFLLVILAMLRGAGG